MVDWLEHPTPMKLTDFPWATEDAWAGQVVARNNKFYYYVPIGNGTWDTFGIGVGVSDKIEGPYKDAIGKPLLLNGGVDPTVFIDDDGQAYMYWGNPKLYYVKLNADIVSYNGSIQTVSLTKEGFGAGLNGLTDPNAGLYTKYNECPWFYERNSLYYMVYSANCCPQNIHDFTSPGPTGPWTHQGVIMSTAPNPSHTNHVGIIISKARVTFSTTTTGFPTVRTTGAQLLLKNSSTSPTNLFPT